MRAPLQASFHAQTSTKNHLEASRRVEHLVSSGKLGRGWEETEEVEVREDSREQLYTIMVLVGCNPFAQDELPACELVSRRV